MHQGLVLVLSRQHVWMWSWKDKVVVSCRAWQHWINIWNSFMGSSLWFTRTQTLLSPSTHSSTTVPVGTMMSKRYLLGIRNWLSKLDLIHVVYENSKWYHFHINISICMSKIWHLIYIEWISKLDIDV